MTGRPLVSVIVPVFEGERYLGEALDSVLAQEYEPVEVIVVDDGSTDGSAEVAQARPVRYLRVEHGGVAAARNAGIEASRGGLIAFIDQDDLWLTGKLTSQVGFLLVNPEVSFVYAWMEVLREPGAPPAWIDHVGPGPVAGYLPGTLVVRREAFDDVGLFDPSFDVGSDADWLARAKDAGLRWYVLPDVVLRYRLHGANSSYRQHVMVDERFRLLRESVARRRTGS